MNHLINYTLQLADNALIIGHRCSEWCGHGPMLEQDIAISNMALDYVGQARNFYQYAAALINQQNQLSNTTEDTLAYLRDAINFKNVLLAEQPNGDWAQTILRQFFFSTYQYFFFQQLQNSSDKQLAAIAEKSLKEVTYHVKWSSEWVIRLGDGTEESNQRINKAIDELWMFTGEMFIMSEDEEALLVGNTSVSLKNIEDDWRNKVSLVFEEATLTVPENGWMQHGGKSGKHTEYLGYILAELQFLQRAYPNATW